MSIILSPELVLYNDMITNHFIRPAGAVTHIGLPGKVVFETSTLVYDPFIKSLWITSTSGQLLHDGKAVTPDVYRQIWGAGVENRRAKQTVLAMALHPRLGAESPMGMFGADIVRMCMKECGDF